MKKKLGLLLASLMCFVGCGNTNNSSSNVNNSSTTQQSSQSSSVVEYQTAVLSLNEKASFVNYKQYKSVQETNKENEFFDRERNYQVGDDNTFDFKPELTLAKLPVGSTDMSKVEIEEDVEWEYDISLSLLKDEEYTEANLTEYTESLDNTKCVIDFSDKAVGNTFKITLFPKNLDNPNNEFTKEYVVDVIDGYNVTNAKELAYIQNHDGDMKDIGSIDGANYKTIWDAFKTANNLTLDYYPAGLILHDDILVTKNDVPSEYFYKSGVDVATTDPNHDALVGSLKDYEALYQRNIADNSKFVLEGNYFSLNVDNLPKVVVVDDSNQIPEHYNSHSNLFRLEGDNTTEAFIQNIKLIGNAPRTEDTTNSGGIIMTKVEGPTFTAYNNIAVRWYITYFPNNTTNPFLMDSCRAYNNFNSIIYSWGGQNVTIKDCEFKRAGGPVIIQDHLNLDTSDTTDDVISSTRIENSVLESYVNGEEGWFQMFSASTLASQITALDPLFNVGGKTFLTKDKPPKLNLISLNKAEGESLDKILNPNTRGSISIKNDAQDVNCTFDYGNSNEDFEDFYNKYKIDASVEGIFESSGNGMAFTKGQTGLEDDNGNITAATMVGDLSHNIYKGDYLCLYKGGMQVVLSYYDFVAE